MQKIHSFYLLCLFLCCLFYSNSPLTAKHINSLSVAPTAEFSASSTLTCTDQIITFTDASTDSPTSWAWSFIPSTITYENGTSATSQHPEVRFTQEGIYNVSLTVMNADGSNTNDKTGYLIVYGVIDKTFAEDFQNGVPPENWIIINPDNLEGWELTDPIGSDGNKTNVIRMDNYQYQDQGQLDYFATPKLDLSRVTTPTLHFDVAHAAYNANNAENLHIEYSTDCGATFMTTTYNKGYPDLSTVGDQSNGWGPQEADHWRAETVDLTPYKSVGTILQFVQTNGYGNGLFIDNIRIEASDPPIANFVANQTLACVGDIIKLNDLSTELPTSYNWSIIPNTFSYENGTSATSVQPEISFSAIGDYTITLEVSNALGNSSFTVEFYAIDVATSNGALNEDFENGVPPVGWAVYDPDNLEGWELTDPIGSDGNKTNVIRMDNYQYQDQGQLDYFATPKLDLSRVTTPTLHFDVAHAAYNANNAENLHIEYSTDCGATFTTTTYNKGYPDLSTVGDQSNGWGPQEADHWRAETVDLTPYKSVGTILQFVQTNGYGNGLFIDNIRIEASDPPIANFTVSQTVACVDETILLTDISHELPTSFSWSFTPNTFSYENGTNANSQHPQIRFSAAGSYDITLTVVNAHGSSQHTESIQVNLDDANYSYSSSSYCKDATNPSPTITGLTGGTFSSTPAGLSLDNNTGEITVGTSTAGTYTVTYTTVGTCPNSMDQSVTITDLDDANYSYSSSSYCKDATNPSPTITGLTGGTFSSTPAGLSLDNNTGEITVGTSTAGTYTVTYTTVGTCPNSMDQSVTITDLDDANYSYSSSSYCKDATNPSPTITGLTGGTFSSTPAGLSLDNNTGEITIGTSTAGTYTVTYTTVGTCPNSMDQSVAITDLDDANYSYSSSSYCKDATNPSPTITGLIGGTFSSTPAGLSLDNNTGEITVGTSTAGTYTVTYTTVGTCPNSMDQSVTITDLDDAACINLAVEWIEFSGQTTANNQVHLDWGIAQLEETSYVNIQHCTNGNVFKNIGLVDTKADQKKYQFIHQQPSIGINYYRLQEVNLLGEPTFSSVISLNVMPRENKITLYPIPATQSLFLDLAKVQGKVIEIQLFDQLGKAISQERLISVQQKVASLDIADIASGVYFIKIKYGNDMEVQRIVKQ